MIRGKERKGLLQPSPAMRMMSCFWVSRILAVHHAPPRSARSSALSASRAAAAFSSRWAIEPVPGMGSMTGERARSQARATCAGVAPRRAATRCSPGRAQRATSAERIPRKEGYAGLLAGGEHVVVLAVPDVVLVLHRDDGRDAARLLELPHGHVGDAEVADLAGALQFHQRAHATRRTGPCGSGAWNW